MSVYRVPILAAALAVIALGVPCKDGAAHDDTCDTVVDVDGTNSGVHLLQQSMKLAEVASHEEVKATGGDVKFAALLQTLRARGGNVAVPQAGKLSARGSSDTAALEPGEPKATEGQGAGATEGGAGPATGPAAPATEGGAGAATGPAAPATEGGAGAATGPAAPATEGGAGAATGDAPAAPATEGGTSPAKPSAKPAENAGNGDAPVVASADGASSEPSTTHQIVWVTPPKGVVDEAPAVAPEDQSVPLGWIIWALIIATCLVLVLLALVVMVYRQNKREQAGENAHSGNLQSQRA